MKRRESDGFFITKLITRLDSSSGELRAPKNVNQLSSNTSASARDPSNICHQRLAHANISAIRAVLSSKQLGMKLADK